MLTRVIPNTQESLPVIGLGSYLTFDVDDRDGPAAVVEAFAGSGGMLVDSSPMYGRSEGVIGECVGSLHLRGKLFLATKVWTSGRASGVAQMEESLRRLRTDQLDLMQVHNLLDVDTHLETLERWKGEGRVRYVGITHYAASAHAAVSKVLREHEVDFVQINYSLTERDAERTVLPLAADLGVGVIVNRPFAGGSLLRRLVRKPVPSWANELQCDSWAQLALKFIVSHPAVTCVIPATSSKAHLLEFVRAGDGPMPDPSMRKRIAQAYDQL